MGCSQQLVHQSHGPYGYGPKWDGHAGTSMCFEPTGHYSFSTGGEGWVMETEQTELSLGPVGTVGLRKYDSHYPYTSRSNKAGAFEHSKCIARNDWGTGARVTRAVEYNRYFKAAESTMSYDRAGVAGHAVWGNQAQSRRFVLWQNGTS